MGSQPRDPSFIIQCIKRAQEESDTNATHTAMFEYSDEQDSINHHYHNDASTSCSESAGNLIQETDSLSTPSLQSDEKQISQTWNHKICLLTHP